MAEANIVGRAVVQVVPVFEGSQRKIAKEIDPAAKAAGKSAGKQLGEGLTEGVSAETKKLEAEVTKYGASMASAQDKVTAAKKRTVEAAQAEAEALAKTRIAAAKLAEVRAKSNAQQSVILAAEDRLEKAFRKTADANREVATAGENLRASNEKLEQSQTAAASASEKLNTHLRSVASESENTSRSTNRLALAFRNAFNRDTSPLRNMAENISRDSKTVTSSLRKMSTDVSNSGTRGGRAFNRFALIASAGLAIIPPLLGAVGSAAIASVGAVVTFADSLKSLVGVAALAPAALVATAGAGGVLTAAFSGMGEALKTASDTSSTTAGNVALDAMNMEDAARGVADAQAAAAKVGVDSARRVADAQENLARVERSVAEDQAAAARKVEEARRNLADVIEQTTQDQAAASRRLADAERSVERANRSVTESQQALNDARKEAADRVEELRDALTGSELSERDAAIRLEEARIDLVAAQGEGLEEGSLAMRKLVLDVDQAAFAYEEAKERSAELREENAQAAAEGVKGNRAVRSATQSLADAQQAAVDAMMDRNEAAADVTRTETQGAREIADAQSDLADAVADVTTVQREGAERISDAQQDISDAVQDSADAQADAAQAIADAQRALTKEQVRQADASADAGKKAADAMAKLSPLAQLAANSILGVHKRLQGVKDIIQDNFFRGFVAPFERLADTVMPQLESGAGRIATVLGIGLVTLMASLTGALDNGELDRLLTSVANIITNLTPAIDPLVQAFVTMAGVGMPYLEVMATNISEAATRFNEFIQTAAANGDLDRWIQDGITGFQDIGRTIVATTGIFNALANAARNGGIDVTLGNVAGFLERIQTIMEGPVFQETMATIFEGAAAGAKGLAAGLESVMGAFVVGGPAFADFLRLSGEIVGLFIGGFAQALSNPTFGKGLTDFMTGLRDGVKEMVPLMPGMTDALGLLMTDLAPVFEALGPTIIEVITGLADGLEDVVEFLGPMLEDLAGSPAAVGLFVAAIVGTAALSALATFAANITAIATGGGLFVRFLKNVPKWAPGAVTWIGRVWGALMGPVGWVIVGITLVYQTAKWFFTETELGIKIVEDAAVAMYLKWEEIKLWYVNEFLPTLQYATGVFQTEMDKAGTTVGIKLYEMQNNAGALKEWWAQKFIEIGDSIDTLVEGARGMEEDINAFFAKMGKDIEEFFRPLREKIDEGQGKIDDFIEGARGMEADINEFFTQMGKDIDEFFRPLSEALDKIPGIFKTAMEGAKKEFEKLQDAAKVPVKFVIEEVMQKGIVEPFNKILPKGLKIPDIKVPEGWKKGGYTGDGNPNDIAGPAHFKEFVFDADVTAKVGPEKLAAMAATIKSKGLGGLAATMGEGNIGGFFEGNAANIRRHGAYYIDAAPSLGPWNFAGAAKLWDGAAGVKVKTGRGQLQGRAVPLERGGGILGYATGNNIDMSPSWMARLGAMQRRTVAAHEIGHALGLPHNTQRSIMQPNLGNMAATPTLLDIRNLQKLYAGGTGKPGEDTGAENPLKGLLGGLLDKVKALIGPDKNIFADVSLALAQKGFDTMFGWVEDIKNGLKNIAGDVGNAIKNFFTGGGDDSEGAHAATLLRDEGGTLPPGLSSVLNATGGDEYVLNKQQWSDIHHLATTRNAQGAGFPSTMNLVLSDGTAFTAYVDHRADRRIDALGRQAATRRRG